MKNHLKNIHKTLVFTGLLTFSAGAFSQTPPALPVKVQVIEATNVPLTYDYPARVKSPSQVGIHARVSGLILEMHYEEGDYVEANDLLYTIDPRPYQAIVDRAKAQVLMEQARLRQAQREKKRVEGLYREKAVSEQERDQAISAYELAEAGLVGAQAALKEAQLNLDYTRVTAPISGLTDLTERNVGDLVGRDYGHTKLTTITQLNPIDAHFSIGEKEYIERIQQIEINTLKYTNNDTPTVSVTHMGQSFIGELDFSGHQVDLETGSVKLRARFDNANNILFPGAFVRIELGGIEAIDVIQIPQKAVLQIGAQAFAYVIKEGKAELIPLNLQRAVGTTWLVDGGLSSGDQLILNNLVKLRPGMAVQVLPQSPEEANPAAPKE